MTSTADVQDRPTGPFPLWAAYVREVLYDEPQAAVAERLGVQQTQVSRWSRGTARPTDRTILTRMIDAYDLDPEQAQVAYAADPTPARGGATNGRKVTSKTPGRHEPTTPPEMSLPASRAPVLDLVRSAKRDLNGAEAAIDKAVAAARAAGIGWVEITAALNQVVSTPVETKP